MQNVARSFRHPVMLTIYSLFLALLLAACGGTAATTPPATTPSVPTPVPTVAPTPTTAPVASSGSMQNYTGDGYTIGYPQDWKATPATNVVTFSDPTQSNYFLVFSFDNAAGVPADSILTQAAQLFQKGAGITDAQDVQLTSATVSLAGESWTQKGFNGTVAGSKDTFIIAATTHASKTFVILDGCPADKYEQTNTTYFTPMAQTFKFTA